MLEKEIILKEQLAARCLFQYSPAQSAIVELALPCKPACVQGNISIRIVLAISGLRTHPMRVGVGSGPFVQGNPAGLEVVVTGGSSSIRK
jgi:hypothetical protein